MFSVRAKYIVNDGMIKKNTVKCHLWCQNWDHDFGYISGGLRRPPQPYALWESKKLKPMLMGKDLAKHPPPPPGEVSRLLGEIKIFDFNDTFSAVFYCV